jgi:hypothetical protein
LALGDRRDRRSAAFSLLIDAMLHAVFIVDFCAKHNRTVLCLKGEENCWFLATVVYCNPGILALLTSRDLHVYFSYRYDICDITHFSHFP